MTGSFEEKLSDACSHRKSTNSSHKTLKWRNTLRRKAKATEAGEAEEMSSMAPRFIESVGLVGRMRTFVIIEVFEGHQIIEHWKCNDLVEHVNGIADGYSRFTSGLEDKANLIKNVKNKIKSIKEEEPQLGLSRTEETTVSEGVTVIHHHHHHYYYKEGMRQESLAIPETRQIPLLSQASRLSYRDLRQILTDGNPIPSIETRRHCIILCLPPLSCIIMADRVFILVVEDLEMDGLVSGLQAIQLHHKGQHSFITERMADEVGPKLMKHCFFASKEFKTKEPSRTLNVSTLEELPLFPLEYQSLELLISAAFEQLDNDVTYLEATYTQLATHHAKECPTTKGGEQINVIKSQARSYQDRVELFDRAINTILSQEEELLLMELTLLKVQQQLLGLLNLETSQPKNPYLKEILKELDLSPERLKVLIQQMERQHPDPNIETLLEFFDQEIEMFRQRTTRLFENIESTERLSKFRLALNRNRLLQWDVGSGMIAVVFGAGTSMSGIFGMNMKSGLEDSFLGFFVFTGFIIFLTFFGVCTVIILIRMIRL